MKLFFWLLGGVFLEIWLIHLYWTIKLIKSINEGYKLRRRFFG